MTGLASWRLAAILLACVCAGLSYRVLDQGVSHTYLDASLASSNEHFKLLSSLLEHQWQGMTKDEVERRLDTFVRSRPVGSTLLKQDPATGAILLEGLTFEFADGKLTTVH
ncbi:Imm58 family immunity protein [Variovorax sp. SRS16]|uniref:Imm58 family immunity protein n=1 Tax=Variovorax sp. SRS16 TaxID=282217 RepID=UPI0013A5716F|nr:immunity protein 58 [Variovorax sp. SRS16]